VVSVGAAILGQMLGSFLVDTFGWFGVTKIPFDPLRLLGIALLVAGLLLFRENRRAQAPRIKASQRAFKGGSALAGGVRE
jgi:uncharacterized membrane protein YfcA